MDDTPYIYQNNDQLSERDISLLNTSRQSRYPQFSDAQQFLTLIKAKFAYILQPSLLNDTDDVDKCMAVFLTYYTNPIWIPVRCHDKMSNNHYLCETKTKRNLSKHSYKHNRRTCPPRRTLIDGACWGISRGTMRGNVHVQGIDVATLVRFLSSWSLGQARRNSIVLRAPDSEGKQRMCLVHHDFESQDYKDWRVEEGCKAEYSLSKYKPLSGESVCQSKLECR